MTEVAAEISANLLFKPSSFSTMLGCVSVILIIWLLSLWKENHFHAMQLQHPSQKIKKGLTNAFKVLYMWLDANRYGWKKKTGGYICRGNTFLGPFVCIEISLEYRRNFSQVVWEKGEFKGKGTDQHLGNWSCLQSCQELDDKIKPPLMSALPSSCSQQVVSENSLWNSGETVSAQPTIHSMLIVSCLFMAYKK